MNIFSRIRSRQLKAAAAILACLVIGFSAARDTAQIASPRKALMADDGLALGFMSVKSAVVAPGHCSLQAGDTVTWRIYYVNIGPADISDFQIRDVFTHLEFVSGSAEVTLLAAGSAAAINTSFDGVGSDATSDLLAPGAVLPVGGVIGVKIDTILRPATPFNETLRNQTSATGSSLAVPLLSDNVDETNIDPAGPGTTAPAGSIYQPQNQASIDPTSVSFYIIDFLDKPVSGVVTSDTGRRISGARVTLKNLQTLQVQTAITNGFGYYTFPLVTVSNYSMTVTHKRYSFENGPFNFELTWCFEPPPFTGMPR